MKFSCAFLILSLLLTSCAIRTQMRNDNPYGQNVNINLNQSANEIYKKRAVEWSKAEKNDPNQKPSPRKYFPGGENEKKSIELIAVTDSITYILVDGHIYELMTKDIDDISVLNVSGNRGSLYLAMIGCIIADGIIGLAFIDSDNHGETMPYGIGFLALIPLTILAFLSSNPTDYYKQPFDKEAIEELKLYSRFPQGINAELYRELMAKYNNGRTYRITN